MVPKNNFPTLSLLSVLRGGQEEEYVFVFFVLFFIVPMCCIIVVNINVHFGYKDLVSLPEV